MQKYCHGKLITAPHRMAATTMITICHIYSFIQFHYFICLIFYSLMYPIGRHRRSGAIRSLLRLKCRNAKRTIYIRKYFTYYTIYIAYLWSYLAGQARAKRPSQCALASSYIYAMFVSTSIYYFLWPDLRFPAIRSIIVVVSDGDGLLTVYRG